VHTVLTIAVTAVDFDPQSCSLRLTGRNVEENNVVKMGAYHTIDLELKHKFSIIKQEWDSIDIERIQAACDPAKSADVAAVVLFICTSAEQLRLDAGHARGSRQCLPDHFAHDHRPRTNPPRHPSQTEG